MIDEETIRKLVRFPPVTMQAVQVWTLCSQAIKRMKVELADIWYLTFRMLFEIKPQEQGDRRPYKEENRDADWNLSLENRLVRFGLSLQTTLYRPFASHRFFSSFNHVTWLSFKLERLVAAANTESDNPFHMMSGFAAVPRWLKSHLSRPLRQRWPYVVAWIIIVTRMWYHLRLCHIPGVETTNWLVLWATICALPCVLGDLHILPPRLTVVLKIGLLLISLLIVPALSLSSNSQSALELGAFCFLNIVVGLPFILPILLYFALLLELYFAHVLELYVTTRMLMLVSGRNAELTIGLWQCIMVLDFVCLFALSLPLRFLLSYVVCLPFTFLASFIVIVKHGFTVVSVGPLQSWWFNSCNIDLSKGLPVQSQDSERSNRRKLVNEMAYARYLVKAEIESHDLNKTQADERMVSSPGLIA